MSEVNDYLYSEKSTRLKSEAFQKLINESPEKMLEENELENLLSVHYEPIDISSKCLSSINNLEDSTESKKFSKKVISDIKQREKKVILYPVILSIAVLLVFGFYVNSNLTQKNQPVGHELKVGDSIIGESTQNFDIGLRVKSYKDSSYTYINSTDEFLRLNKGPLRLNVIDQPRKSPLIFSMTHGKVKVLGTDLILLNKDFFSEVFVTKGKVEFYKNDIFYALGPGEIGYADEESIRKSFQLLNEEWNYKFENSSSSPDVDGKIIFKPGIIGKSLEFNRLQKVRIQRKLNTENESFSLWVKILEPSPIGQSIAGQHDPVYSTNGFHLYEEKGKLHLQIKNKEEEFGKVYDIDLSKWTHLVFTKNKSGSNKLYIDGSLYLDHNMKFKYENSSKFYLGRSEDRFWAPLHGLIDELRIYQKTLNEKEVKKLYSEKDLIKNVTK